MLSADVIVQDERWEEVGLTAIGSRSVDAVGHYFSFPEGCEICILGTDNAEVQRLNTMFRAKDKPTNVLSFPSGERGSSEPGKMPEMGGLQDELGDVALGYEICAEEAFAAGKPLEDHICHLVVHGILHCLGFDHENEQDAALMERIEIEILGNMGIQSPY